MYNIYALIAPAIASVHAEMIAKGDLAGAHAVRDVALSIADRCGGSGSRFDRERFLSTTVSGSPSNTPPEPIR